MFRSDLSVSKGRQEETPFQSDPLNEYGSKMRDATDSEEPRRAVAAWYGRRVEETPVLKSLRNEVFFSLVSFVEGSGSCGRHLLWGKWRETLLPRVQQHPVGLQLRHRFRHCSLGLGLFFRLRHELKTADSIFRFTPFPDIRQKSYSRPWC